MPDVKEKTEIIASDENQSPILFQRPMLIPGPPMMQLQQPMDQRPYPILFFLFPRIVMLLMMRGGAGYGQRGVMVQHITQLIRDKEGRITEVIEFIR